MYEPKESSQNEYEFVSIDELVPDEHLLRLIDKYVDFTFLLKKVKFALFIVMITVALLIP